MIRHHRARTGRQPNRGSPPAKAEKIADKSVLWKPCGVGTASTVATSAAPWHKRRDSPPRRNPPRLR